MDQHAHEPAIHPRLLVPTQDSSSSEKPDLIVSQAANAGIGRGPHGNEQHAGVAVLGQYGEHGQRRHRQRNAVEHQDGMTMRKTEGQ